MSTLLIPMELLVLLGCDLICSNAKCWEWGVGASLLRNGWREFIVGWLLLYVW